MLLLLNSIPVQHSTAASLGIPIPEPCAGILGVLTGVGAGAVLGPDDSHPELSANWPSVRTMVPSRTVGKAGTGRAVGGALILVR